MKTPIKLFFISIFLLLLQSCGMFMLPPTGVEVKSKVGEPTASGLDFRNLPKPKEEERDDHFLQIGVGLQFYFGNRKK